jgi:two-component system, LuxR family, response regulator FixJ
VTTGTVFVVDDDPAVRDSLALLLGLQGLATRLFDSGEAFLETCDPSQGGCALIDLRMDGMSGLDLQAVMNARGWLLPCIVMSAYGDVATTRAALKAGAVDFLEKPLTDPAVLLDVVQHALEIDVARRQAAARVRGVHERFERLTPRERDVMRRLADGMSNRQVAEDLGISPRTVEIYKSRGFEKMQVRTTAELVRLSIELGSNVEAQRAAPLSSSAARS